MKLSDLHADVRRNLMETDSNGRFSDSVINGLVNEGLFEVADRLDVLIGEASISVSADQETVDLPSGALGVKIVRWNGTGLLETTPEYLDTIETDWTEKKGTPTRYYTNGPGQIRLVPIPIEAGDVHARYTRAPVTLTQDSDETDLPDFLAAAAPLYATYMAHLSDDRLNQADRWLALFERRIEQLERRLGRRQSVASGLRIRAEKRR